MKLYLAGPMRGIPEFNFPAFYAAAATLRGTGHEVFSPAEQDEKRWGAGITASVGTEQIWDEKLGLPPGGALRLCLHDDLDYILDEADGIALLKGWERSRGALAEFMLARALDHVMLFEYDGFTRIWTQADMPVLHNVTMNPEYTWRKP